jgi:O-acetyl-ADP-ribose deacetylase (regulator of RNase III)
MRELEQIRADVGRVPAGEAVATSAGELPARWVFHAVGPIYENGQCGEPEALRSCYRTCLDMAEERGATTISFPSISTGVYGYPVSEAARVALGEVARFLREDAASVETAMLVLFDRDTYAAYDSALDALASREQAKSQKAGR